MNATQMYAMSLDQCANVISVGGHLRTVLVQGDMGTGKSSLLSMLAKEHPKHVPCYFDCTTKDLGDVTIPDLIHMDDGTGFVRYLTNEELGAHLDQPIILMIDEFGKSNAAVKLALLRLMLERKIGSYTLHPDSLVFATTNKGSEGVGDLLPAHARNRITIVNEFDHICIIMVWYFPRYGIRINFFQICNNILFFITKTIHDDLHFIF